MEVFFISIIVIDDGFIAPQLLTVWHFNVHKQLYGQKVQKLINPSSSLNVKSKHAGSCCEIAHTQLDIATNSTKFSSMQDVWVMHCRDLRNMYVVNPKACVRTLTLM